jgi:hypothetical protein
MLCAHMDELGFIVQHVEDEGFVRIVPVGFHDARMVVDQDLADDAGALIADDVRPRRQLTAGAMQRIAALDADGADVDEDGAAGGMREGGHGDVGSSPRHARAGTARTPDLAMDNVWSAGISNRFRSIVLTGNAKKGCARHMHRSDNRILTTHTGSLPRPPALVALFCARNEGGAAERLFGAKA